MNRLNDRVFSRSNLSTPRLYLLTIHQNSNKITNDECVSIYSEIQRCIFNDKKRETVSRKCWFKFNSQSLGSVRRPPVPQDTKLTNNPTFPFLAENGGKLQPLKYFHLRRKHRARHTLKRFAKILAIQVVHVHRLDVQKGEVPQRYLDVRPASPNSSWLDLVRASRSRHNWLTSRAIAEAVMPRHPQTPHPLSVIYTFNLLEPEDSGQQRVERSGHLVDLMVSFGSVLLFQFHTLSGSLRSQLCPSSLTSPHPPPRLSSVI